MFTWYWRADLCLQHKIPFVLGHALFMKAIHGGKAKNDKIDSEKIAMLLRGGMLPQAYAYPHKMRATRDLLRKRMYLMHHRAEALARIMNTASQYNLPPITKKLTYAATGSGRLFTSFPTTKCSPLPSTDNAISISKRANTATAAWRCSCTRTANYSQPYR
jgi:Transposase